MLLARLDSLEAQLLQVHDDLARSQRLATLGTLAATIVHEYNNLLTPILTYAQLALDHPDEAALTRKALTKAVNGAQQAARISESLLEFAREDATANHAAASNKGSETANSGDSTGSNLRNAVQAALDCLVRDPAKDGIAVQLDVSEVHAAMDDAQLRQVLLNLFINARKAMTQHRDVAATSRRPQHTLSVTAQAEQGQAVITVQDTGPGIPDELLPRLFEAFVTDHHQPTQGSGLGLSLCRHLVTQAGGSIDAANTQPAGGAVFTIRLPLAA